MIAPFLMITPLKHLVQMETYTGTHTHTHTMAKACVNQAAVFWQVAVYVMWSLLIVLSVAENRSLC